MKTYDSLTSSSSTTPSKSRLHFVRGCGSVFLKETVRSNGTPFFAFFGTWKGIIGVKLDIYIYIYIRIGTMGNNFPLNLNHSTEGYQQLIPWIIRFTFYSHSSTFRTLIIWDGYNFFYVPRKTGLVSVDGIRHSWCRLRHFLWSVLSRAPPLHTVPQDEGHTSHPLPRESELVLRGKNVIRFLGHDNLLVSVWTICGLL